MKNLLFPSTILLVSLLCFTPVFGEESLRGRLPDGRAFRTDAQGVQIVDYIAELELSIEALNRRVAGLEIELEQKNSELERAAKAPLAPGLVERDLLNHSAQMEKVEAAADEPAGAEPARLAEMETRLTAANRTIQRLTGELAAERKRTAEADRRLLTDLQRAQEQEALAANATAVWQKKADVAGESVRAYQSELERVRAAMLEQEKLIQIRNKEIETLRAKNNEREAARLNLSRQETLLRERDKEIAALRAKLAALTAETKPLAAIAFVPKEKIETSGRYSEERQRAADAVRSELLSDMNKLQGLVQRRNEKYRQYKSRNHALQFQMTPLVSSRKLTLAALKSRITSTQDVRELNNMKADLRQIRNKVQDDIALMDRLLR